MAARCRRSGPACCHRRPWRRVQSRLPREGSRERRAETPRAGVWQHDELTTPGEAACGAALRERGEHLRRPSPGALTPAADVIPTPHRPPNIVGTPSDKPVARTQHGLSGNRRVRFSAADDDARSEAGGQVTRHAWSPRRLTLMRPPSRRRTRTFEGHTYVWPAERKLERVRQSTTDLRTRTQESARDSRRLNRPLDSRSTFSATLSSQASAFARAFAIERRGAERAADGSMSSSTTATSPANDLVITRQ